MAQYVLRDYGDGSDLHTWLRAQRCAVGFERRGERVGRGGGCADQLARQMALDMRPRSTCRRLTKAIPAVDMGEAWHADLRPVHHDP
ncbi:hypothetical protein GCM10011583_16020 [Streptomyces camponoticapitis]|uniref:Uncharacterized protein n=1 Tax=Streptomyces camponoticapitis TaxID=1616125 RepID=A0ABQ2E0P3_9ACTN|nr:hypothetical protein GCM10011583_16020 [Streptomyces camponoticapitis]